MKIKTEQMSKSGYLQDIDLSEIAKETKNYTGAEIEGLVKNAVSYSLSKEIDFNNLSQISKIEPKLTNNDFQKAISEIRPAFGMVSDTIQELIHNMTIPETYQEDLQILSNIEKGKIFNVCITGKANTGKTIYSAFLANGLNYEYTKIIRPEDLLDKNKTARIIKTFYDSKRSKNSIIIFDNIERIIEFTRLRMLYNNDVLQTLLTIAGSSINIENKSILVFTTRDMSLLKELDFVFSHEITLN